MFEVRVEVAERAGPLRAVDLIAGLKTLLDDLAAAEAASDGGGPRRVTWLVRDLHHSAATIVLAPEDRTAQARAAAQQSVPRPIE